MDSTLLAIGLFLLGGLFVAGGIKHFFTFGMLADFMDKRGVPFPRFTLFIGTVFQIVLGLPLMAGYFVAPAALSLAVFTLAASIMFMNFWDMTGEMRDNTMNMFLVNVALIGGLLVAAAQAL